jgi:phage FluMu protein Com
MVKPVVYACSGLNEHGKRCGKLLLMWTPPSPNGREPDHGRIEIKCRRCKTLNYIKPVPPATPVETTA